MNRVLLAAAGLMLAPTMALAEGFSTEDLGSTNTEDQCMERARLVYEEFDRASGVGQIVAGNWTISAFDVIRDDYDAHITCAFGPNDTTRATLVVYGNDSGTPEERSGIARRMKAMWEAWE
ncbi:MAG: hypothetical protein AAF674_08365 [Pseudomonadota bacterium]